MPDPAPAETDSPSPDPSRPPRGRHKIFLGAAPGVGKTFAMLEAGQRRRKEGLDTLAAVVETHGRAETEMLLHGLDVLQRRPVFYRGKVLYEMDLDGLLARRPALALIDELAHSQPRREPSREALAGCRGGAGRRHRRLFDDERPAHRDAERSRGADHRHKGEGDGARPHPRRGRRDRADRPAARGSDRPAAARARSMSPSRRRGRRKTSSPKAT